MSISLLPDYSGIDQPVLGDSSLTNLQNQSVYNNQINLANQDSWLGKGGVADTTLGTFGKIGGAAASLGQIYVGLKSLDIANQELAIKKDQWDMSKKELQHMQDTRKKLTASYMGR